ncbi:MAG: 6-bladed beta-propeller [Candidatus Aminicenantes bacterium]|nr:6-bladed beta-propeller [Candidatus Aminicenantes bacterium]
MKRMFWLLLVLLLSVSLVMATDTAGKIRVITDPRPTHDENRAPLRRLVKVGEITSNLEDEFFLVRPWNVCADNQGNIYVFDLKVRKFFKYDKNFKLVRVFGNAGQGPGEYAPGNYMVDVDVVKNRFLFFADDGNRKLIRYDLDGNPLGDIPFPRNRKDYLYPLQGPLESYLSIDRENNCINAVDSRGEFLYPVLSRSELEASLLLEIKPREYAFVASLYPDEVRCAFVTDHQLAVFLMSSSVFYLFDREKQVRKIPIWPKEILGVYRERVKGRDQSPKLKNAFFTMFNNWFFDGDSQRHFYLEPPGHRELLQFDLEGNLTARFSTPCRVILMAKAGHRFYGVYKESIIILKEGRDAK